MDIALAPLIEASPRRIIHGPRTENDACIIVRSGILGLYKPSLNGNIQIASLRYPGEVITPFELRIGFGVQALTQADFIRLPSEQFRNLVKHDYEFRQVTSENLRKHQAIGLEWVVRSGLDASAKMAHLWCETLERCRVDEEVFRIPFTQTQIGWITGQTSVNVNRVIKSWRDQNLVSGGSSPLVTDWDEMRRIGRFDGAYLEQDKDV